MSNFPTNNGVVNHLDMTMTTLNGLVGVEAKRDHSKRSVIVRIAKPTLDLFDGQEANIAANKRFIKSMVFGFQELLAEIKSGKIDGFAIAPSTDIEQDAVYLNRTILIGSILQSICDGTTTLD